MSSEQLLEQLTSQITELTAKVDALLAREPLQEPPEVYTVYEFATLAKVSPYTVRRWLNTAQLNGRKANVVSGPHREWRIPHDEWLRYRRDGLLPQRFVDRGRRERSNGTARVPGK